MTALRLILAASALLASAAASHAYVRPAPFMGFHGFGHGGGHPHDMTGFEHRRRDRLVWLGGWAYPDPNAAPAPVVVDAPAVDSQTVVYYQPTSYPAPWSAGPRLILLGHHAWHGRKPVVVYGDKLR